MTTSAERVSMATIRDRLRVATTKPWNSGGQLTVTSSRDARRLSRALANIAAMVIEDGPYDGERDELDQLVNDLHFEIDKRICEFAYRIENEHRSARGDARLVTA